MAIILEAAYRKTLGLPHFSSHSYVVSLRTELADLSQVEAESARLYPLLQRSVDAQIQAVGFLPDGFTYGQTPTPPPPQTPFIDPPANHDPLSAASPGPAIVADRWVCSDKQQLLIRKLVEQYRLAKKAVDALAKELFALPVKALNRLQASGLIEELLARHSQHSAARIRGQIRLHDAPVNGHHSLRPHA